MSLLDIDNLVTDKLREIKFWIENNIVFPPQILEYERGTYIDNLFKFIKKGKKYYVNVETGLIFKDDCDNIPYNLFEFYKVAGGVTIKRVIDYKGFPQIMNSLQIDEYLVPNNKVIFGPSVVVGIFYIKRGLYLYESNLSHNEIVKNGRNLPKYIHNYCVDSFLYESTKKKFENCMYIGKIANIG